MSEIGNNTIVAPKYKAESFALRIKYPNSISGSKCKSINYYLFEKDRK